MAVFWSSLEWLVVENPGILFLYTYSILSRTLLTYPITTQDILPEGATLVPILFGVDSTNINILDRISYCLLYLIIANLPKKIWYIYSQHAYVLVAYLPSLNVLGMEGYKGIFTDTRRMLYHYCMWIILKDLDNAI